MARVTVEDCLDHVENRFDLVLKAAQRARDLELGAADPLVPRDNDKPTVVALREIAQGFNVTDLPQEEESDMAYAAEMLGVGEVFVGDTNINMPTSNPSIFGDSTTGSSEESAPVDHQGSQPAAPMESVMPNSQPQYAENIPLSENSDAADVKSISEQSEDMLQHPNKLDDEDKI